MVFLSVTCSICSQSSFFVGKDSILFFLINPFAPNAPFLKNRKVFILKNFVFIVKKNLKFCFLKFFCFIISLTFYTPFSLSLWLTHLFLVHPFSTPRKTENLTVSRCFQGLEKGCIGNKWVKFGNILRQYFKFL